MCIMSYVMRVFCKNCNKLSNIEIPKGTVKEDVVKDIECPHCEVVGKCQYT